MVLYNMGLQVKLSVSWWHFQSSFHWFYWYREYELQSTLSLSVKMWPNSSPPTWESVSWSLCSQSVFFLCWLSLFFLSHHLFDVRRNSGFQSVIPSLNRTPRLFTRLNLVGALLLDCSHTSEKNIHTTCDVRWHEMALWNMCMCVLLRDTHAAESKC